MKRQLLIKPQISFLPRQTFAKQRGEEREMDRKIKTEKGIEKEIERE